MKICLRRSAFFSLATLTLALVVGSRSQAQEIPDFIAFANRNIAQDCTAPFTQICKPKFQAQINVPEPGFELGGQFFSGFQGCSSIKIHYYVDGSKTATSDLVGAPHGGPSTEITSVGFVSAGNHLVEMEAEGVVGGCNSGALSGWSGQVVFYRRISSNQFNFGFTLEPSTITLSDLTRTALAARLTTKDGKPAVGETLVNTGPAWKDDDAGLFPPRTVICNAQNQLVYPFEALDHTTNPFLPTDTEGKVDYIGWSGRDPGNNSGALQSLFFTPNSIQVAEFEAPVSGTPQTSLVAASLSSLLASLMVASPEQNGGISPFNAAFPDSPESIASLQESTLFWLALNRAFSPNDAVRQFDYGPVHTKDGRAAILFYPLNNPWPIIQHVNHGSAIPQGYNAFIAELKSFGNNSVSFEPLQLENFDDWSDAVNGVVLGILREFPRSDLIYFGYPYPPLPSTVGYDEFTQCLGFDLFSDTVTVHSPVRLEFRSLNDLRMGISQNGQILTQIPGGVFRSGVVDYYRAPRGDYDASIFAFRQGVANIVSRSPQPGTQRVLTFNVKKGDKGSLSLKQNQVTGSAKVAGKKIKAKSGFTISVSGLPKSVSAKKGGTVKVKLKNSVKQIVSGARVTVKAGKKSFTAITDNSGAAKIQLPGKLSGKKLSVTITAANHATTKKSVPLR